MHMRSYSPANRPRTKFETTPVGPFLLHVILSADVRWYCSILAFQFAASSLSMTPPEARYVFYQHAARFGLCAQQYVIEATAVQYAYHVHTSKLLRQLFVHKRK